MGKNVTERKKGDVFKKKTKKELKLRAVLPETGSSEDEVDFEKDDGGIFFGKDDIQLIYNALREYKPTDEEDHLHGVLLEMFEEILVADFGEPYPDAN